MESTMPARVTANAVIRAGPFIFVSFSFRRVPIGCAPGICCNWPRAGVTETRIEKLYSCFGCNWPRAGVTETSIEKLYSCFGCNWPRAGVTETRIEKLYSCFRPALPLPDGAGNLVESEKFEPSQFPLRPA